VPPIAKLFKLSPAGARRLSLRRRNHWPAIASDQEKIAGKIYTMAENLATQKTIAQFTRRDIAVSCSGSTRLEMHR
jgi:hypothetical protein